MSIVILHLSDIHFSVNKPENPLKSKQDSLFGAIRNVIAPGDQVAVVYSGDIADWGKEEEYILASEFIQSLDQNIQLITKKKHKKRSLRTTEVSKLTNLLNLDPHGTEYKTSDGFVKINISKFILKKLTMEEVVHFNKQGKNVTTDYYKCLLFSTVANKNHSQFIKVGTNTGNLTKHCDKFHENAMNGIKELLLKTPKDFAIDVVKQYISKQAVPFGQLDVLFARRKETNVRLECALFIWML